MKRLFFLIISTCIITPLLTAATTANAETQPLNTNLAHTGDVVSGLLQPVFPIAIDSDIISVNGDSLTGQRLSSSPKGLHLNDTSLDGQTESKGFTLNSTSLDGQRIEPKGATIQGTALDGQTESKGFTLNSTSLDGQSAIAQ